MSHSKERMARSQLYVDRAVRWVNDFVVGRYASPIIWLGNPDQGDAISWKLKDSGEKYWFRTIDAKEAHRWGDTKHPPKEWGGLMLTRDGQLHTDWIYLVINEPMTRLAFIDMSEWHKTTLAEEIDTTHPETGDPQISMRMPMRSFKFFDLEKL